VVAHDQVVVDDEIRSLLQHDPDDIIVDVIVMNGEGLELAESVSHQIPTPWFHPTSL